MRGTRGAGTPTGRVRTAVVVGVVVGSALWSSGLAAAPASEATTIDGCDWSSFRNGLANPGASTCTALGTGNVSTLTPQFFYRTRDSVTATPAVVDGVLYVGSWDGTFAAFDTEAVGFGDPSFADQPITTVEPIWEFQITDTNDVSFGRIVSSAAVADIGDTRVVVFAGGATVYALDAANGSLLAELCLDPRSDADAPQGRCRGTERGEIEVETSPALVPTGPSSVAIIVGQDNHNDADVGRTGVVRLALERSGSSWTMRPEWKFDPEANAVITGPDLLTAGSGTGDGCGGVWGTPAIDVASDLVVLGTASCNTGGDPADVAGEKVFGIHLSTGAPRWRFDPPRPWGSDTDDDFGSSPQLFVVDGELVAGAGSKDGWYYALDAASGAHRWSTQAGQPGHADPGFAIGGIIGSPALGLVAGRAALFMTTAISTPVGAPLGSGPPPDSIDASLADDPARLLSLHALDAATGAVLWRSPLTRQTYGHPTYTNGVVFVPSTAGLSVQAFAADTGLPLWSSPVGATSSGVAVTDAGIYLGAGTRQTDAGFKLQGNDSTVPDEVQAVLALTPAADYLGADPQERLSGVWGFRLAG